MNGDHTGIFKWATSFLAGVVLTGTMAYVAGQKDLITRREYTEQNLRFEQHLEAHDKQLEEEIQMVSKNTIEITRILEDMRLGVHPK